MSKSIVLTLGAALIGTNIAGVLTGVVCTQVLMYFRRYQRDRFSTKLMVFAIWLLDMLHTVMVIASSWAWLIANFGSTDTDRIPGTVAVSVLITAIITIIVHGFFISRVYRLSHSLVITTPLVVLGLLRVGSASATCAKMLAYGRFSLFLDNVGWLFTLGLSTSSALDILLTGILLYYLRKSKTGFPNLDHIIDTLSLYTLQSGLLTTITIVISLGFWIGMNDNLVFLALHFTISKLYAASFLATLNARDGIRDRHIGIPQDLPPSVFLETNPFGRQSRASTLELPMQVNPDSPTPTTANTVSRVIGEVGVTYLTKAFRVGRLSFDVRNAHGLVSECKLPTNAVV